MFRWGSEICRRCGKRQRLFTHQACKDVFSRIQSVKQTLWIGTADIKDLYVERKSRPKKCGDVVESRPKKCMFAL